MEFYKGFDEILKEHNQQKALNYLEDKLEEAIINKDSALIITVLNEIIGYNRDLSLYEDSYSYAKSLYSFILNKDIDYHTRFISYINIANSYRVNKKYEESNNLLFEALKIYDEYKLNDNL